LPTLLLRYQSLVDTGRIEADPAQAAAVAALTVLVEQIGEKRLARKSSALGWLFSRKSNGPILVKGLYLWGAVGRGKTMLMDLFFDSLSAQRKKRVHFHDFMADVHERIHLFRENLKQDENLKRGIPKNTDPIQPVAAAIAEEAWVLCFDEFTVNDIADAMILGRLFAALWEKGVVVVATSNVDPTDLYKSGLNRALFLPFIAQLQDHMNVLRLNARTDYRLEKLSGAPVYHVPADARAGMALDAMWENLTGGADPKSVELIVRTRKISVPAAAQGVARFRFEDLCAKPLGASDYLMVARDFHTVIIDHIPMMDYTRRNEAKRFIILIDILYEYHVKLVVSAAAEPHLLYQASDGREVFEFDRTVSRLIEMRSESYLAQAHGRAGGDRSGNLGGLVET
jgi:cell division protein ZapE